MNALSPPVRPLAGTLVVFLAGQTDMDLFVTEIVEVKAVRSAPSYPDVILKQKLILRLAHYPA